LSGLLPVFRFLQLDLGVVSQNRVGRNVADPLHHIRHSDPVPQPGGDNGRTEFVIIDAAFDASEFRNALRDSQQVCVGVSFRCVRKD
jgi:hypothetical protein